jgi:Flp pilus assembly protein TadD
VSAESWRVAQIVVDCGASSFRGSGYLVAPGCILTAAHVLAEATAVRVRLDVGQPAEVDVQAERWWADPKCQDGADLAVVTIPVDVTAGRVVERARFGRISDCTAVLAVQTLGFPRFKLRSGGIGEPGQIRDLEHVTGHAPVAANRRQGTLAVYLDDPLPASAGDVGNSPWEGMSGATVWAGGRIIGVVAEHHPSEGTGRLTARRIDRAYGHLREPDSGPLINLLGLPSTARELPDVVPAKPGQVLQSAYLEQVRDIAPEALISRESELTEWGEFCAGSKTYVWWQAAPWAGKTALASWFVTHPPAGVDIVSFFITGRLAGQADSDAFLDAMIEQLNALAPTSEGSVVTTGARVGAWLSLLASTAAQAEERARRLIVVVDGLDEDDAGAVPRRGRPSIASLLPRHPPPGVRFIVTSRPDPGLPDDVPAGHPLRTCAVRYLAVSWVAEDLAQRAQQELRDLLAGSQTALDVVGYIAGSGGGLTKRDLSALTGAPPLKIDPIVRGVFGRSLQTRAPTDLRDAETNYASRVYLFAHETLRVIAEEQLGTELARYQQGIHDWIGSFASLGWPDTTPGYAVRGYLRLLTTTGDAARMAALARDPRRHAFLSRATTSDYTAFTEIRNAQELLTGQSAPNLQALVELAVYRHAIFIRNQSISVGLPAVWAQLGRFDHAEALATAIARPDARDEALRAVTTVMAQARDFDRAEAIARAISGPHGRDKMLQALALKSATNGDLTRAEQLVHAINGLYVKHETLQALAIEAAKTGDPSRAEYLTQAISDRDAQDETRRTVAAAIARSGDLTRAETLARSITTPYPRDKALSAVAAAIARSGDLTRAETLARSITTPYPRDEALSAVAAAIARSGDLTRAETLAQSITTPYPRDEALSAVAAAIARSGDLTRADVVAYSISNPDARDRALRPQSAPPAETDQLDKAEAHAHTLANLDVHAQSVRVWAIPGAKTHILDQAEADAYASTSPNAQMRMLTDLAAAAIRAGDLDRAYQAATDAEALAHAITDPASRNEALHLLAAAAAMAGDLDHAEALAHALTDPSTRDEALYELAGGSAMAGDLDRAEALARTISGSNALERARHTILKAAIRTGDYKRAEDIARTLNTDSRAQALAGLAVVISQAGDLRSAKRLVTDGMSLLRPDADAATRGRTLCELAKAMACVGDLDAADRLITDAEAIIRTIEYYYTRDKLLRTLAVASVQVGNVERAEALARTISSYSQPEELQAIAVALAQANRVDRAEALTRALKSPAQDEALHALATVVTKAGDLDRAETFTRAIIKSEIRARTFKELAIAAAKVGDMDRAETLARNIAGNDAKASTLGALAAAAAQAGDHARTDNLITNAETFARAITNSDGRARAFTELATAIAEVGDLDSARHLLALAINVDPPRIRGWIEAISLFFPSIIRAAGEVFVDAYKTQAS